jgi:hypothetical protein
MVQRDFVYDFRQDYLIGQDWKKKIKRSNILKRFVIVARRGIEPLIPP